MIYTIQLLLENIGDLSLSLLVGLIFWVGLETTDSDSEPNFKDYVKVKILQTNYNDIDASLA